MAREDWSVLKTRPRNPELVLFTAKYPETPTITIRAKTLSALNSWFIDTLVYQILIRQTK